MGAHHLAGYRVLKGQTGGMEQQLSRLFSRAIEPVPDNGDSEPQGVSGVQAELMGASGQGGEFDPTASSFDGHESPVADAHLAVQRVINLVGAVVRIQSERQGDLTCLLGDYPLQQGDIVLVHQPFGKLDGKMAMGRAGPGHYHQAGGVHVEAVYGRLVDTVREQRLDPVDHAVLTV